MEEKKEYKFKILREEVSDSDKFEEEPHEKIAEAISKVITSSSTGYTIGLQGETHFDKLGEITGSSYTRSNWWMA